MAGGGFAESGGPRAELYEHKVTWYLIFTCIVAAMGGSLFGYDLGVSGNFLSSVFFFYIMIFIYDFLKSLYVCSVSVSVDE